MRNINEETIDELKSLAKILAVMGVRNNTDLEDLHAGISPASKTGDYSDVKVVTPYGEIEWNQLSRISDPEMRSLMLSVERALELALCTYESLSEEERQILSMHPMTHRSYDREDYKK